MNNFSKKMEKLRTKLISLKFSPKVIFFILGIASTLWFLIRVLPKPQRATYPCMRAAAPVMSGFIIYLLSLGGSLIFFRKAFNSFKKAKYVSAIVALVVCLVLIATFNVTNISKVYSNILATPNPKYPVPDSVNTPVGAAWGVNPGRVAWTFSRNATNENCPNTIVNGDTASTNAFFQSKNTNQDTINFLANKAIKIVAGKNTVAESWDAIFKSFNERKTGTASSYVAGQKIFIKVNNGQAGWCMNSDMTERSNSSSTGVGNAAISETSPQAVLAFLVQLIDSCGIAQTDIMIGEPMTHVFQSMYFIVHPKYPNVILLDNQDKTSFGRTTSSGWHSSAIKWSDKGKVMTSAVTDDIMNEMYNADYMINISALKAHARSGVTLSAKNHFGSSTHGGSYSAERVHAGSINITSMSSANGGNDNLTNARGSYHMYRVLTDIMGHGKFGRNTVLFVVDGLWGGIEATDMPVKWQMAPFNNDFPSSLFVSQDEIALQSVCLDFLRAEANINSNFKNRPFFPAVDDYLHQGATKANWPDSIISTAGKWYAFAGYDPEGDGTFIPSLGVHEHWNNPTDKQYSRDLYANGTGIDLVSYPSNLVARETATADNLTITVLDGTTPVANAIIVIKGSNYMTDADGNVVIGNLTDMTGLQYKISAKGHADYTGYADISGDTQVTYNYSPDGVREATVPENMFTAFPNPVFNAKLNISYRINSNNYVTLMIVSMDGKIVKNINESYKNAGSYNLKMNTSDLKNGTYICILKCGNEVSSLKILIQ